MISQITLKGASVLIPRGLACVEETLKPVKTLSREGMLYLFVDDSVFAI